MTSEGACVYCREPVKSVVYMASTLLYGFVRDVSETYLRLTDFLKTQHSFSFCLR